MKNLIIVGAGGFGREVAAWAEHAIKAGQVGWQIKGFLDDDPESQADKNLLFPVLGDIASYQFSAARNDVFIVALGQIDVRQRVVADLKARGARFVQLIHPTAVIGHNVDLGEGVIVCPHAVVSSNATVGDFSVINLHATVDHDAVLGSYCQINCHADITGYVRFGDRVLMGSHATVLPGFEVGDDAVIGAGAVVTEDVQAGLTVFSPPARMLKTVEEVAAR